MGDNGVKMVVWGNPDDIAEVAPVALFPAPVPEDLVVDFVTKLIAKDPNGDIGKETKKQIEEQIAVEKKMMEASDQGGLAPGEVIPEGAIIMSEDDAAKEGPFVV